MFDQKFGAINYLGKSEFIWMKLFSKSVSHHKKYNLKKNPKNWVQKHFLLLLQLECGLFSHLIVVISGIVLYLAALEVCGILYVFPVSQCDLNLTPSEKGILGGAAPLGIICSAHLWGYLADTKGRRAVILPTLFAAFFSSLFATFFDNFYMLAMFRFLNGFL